MALTPTSHICLNEYHKPTDPDSTADLLISMIDSGVPDINHSKIEPLVIFYNPYPEIDTSATSTFTQVIISKHWEKCIERDEILADGDYISDPQIKASVINGKYVIRVESYPNEMLETSFQIMVSRSEMHKFFLFMDQEEIPCYDCDMKYFSV